MEDKLQNTITNDIKELNKTEIIQLGRKNVRLHRELCSNFTNSEKKV